MRSSSGSRRSGGKALAATCDVTEPEQLTTLRVVTEEVYGPADVLVNSAGMRGGGEFTKLDYDKIEDHVRLNVLGVLFGTPRSAVRRCEARSLPAA